MRRWRWREGRALAAVATGVCGANAAIASARPSILRRPPVAAIAGGTATLAKASPKASTALLEAEGALSTSTHVIATATASAAFHLWHCSIPMGSRITEAASSAFFIHMTMSTTTILVIETITRTQRHSRMIVSTIVAEIWDWG